MTPHEAGLICCARDLARIYAKLDHAARANLQSEIEFFLGEQDGERFKAHLEAAVAWAKTGGWVDVPEDWFRDAPAGGGSQGGGPA